MVPHEHRRLLQLQPSHPCPRQVVLSGEVVVKTMLYELVHLKKNSPKFPLSDFYFHSLYTPRCKGSQVNWKSVCQSWIQLSGCASCVFILGPRLKGEQVPWGGSSTMMSGDDVSRNTRRLLRFHLKTCSVCIPLDRASAMASPKARDRDMLSPTMSLWQVWMQEG